MSLTAVFDDVTLLEQTAVQLEPGTTWRPKDSEVNNKNKNKGTLIRGHGPWPEEDITVIIVHSRIVKNSQHHYLHRPEVFRKSFLPCNLPEGLIQAYINASDAIHGHSASTITLTRVDEVFAKFYPPSRRNSIGKGNIMKGASMIVRLLAIRAASECAASNKRPELSVAGD